jgi:hypothetical protein
MKKNIYLITIGFLYLIVSDATSQTLFVKATTGSQSSYPISSVRSITFSSNDIYINKTDGTKTSFSLDNTDDFWFNSTITGLVGNKYSNQISGINIFPNPVENETKISFNLLTTENVEIVLYNLTGEQIMKLNEEGTIGYNQISFSLPSSLNNGQYIVQVRSLSQVQTTKLIKY